MEKRIQESGDRIQNILAFLLSILTSGSWILDSYALIFPGA
jgi:hypothetical protein